MLWFATRQCSPQAPPPPTAQPLVLHYLLESIFTPTTEGVCVRGVSRQDQRKQMAVYAGYIDPTPIIPHPQLQNRFSFSALSANKRKSYKHQ